MVTVIENLIEEFKGGLSGQLIDRGRVVDQLLDLRLAAQGQSRLTALVDEILSNIPGRNVVENSWWVDTLDRLASAVVPQAVV